MNEPTNEPLTTKTEADSILTTELTKPSGSTQQALNKRNKQFKRVSLKDQQSLTFVQDPRFHYREVIDKGGRISKFLKAGYEMDLKPDSEREGRSKDASNIGKYRNRIVGTTDKGQEIRAYMMRIKKEWYEADQKAKMDTLDRKMEASVASIQGTSSERPSREGTYGNVVIDTTEK